MHFSRPLAAFAGLAAASLVTGAVLDGAAAVNADHADRLVSIKPAAFTPHVMDGSVNAIVQVGSRIVAAGTFTSVSPASTFDDTSDDLVRRGIFAFDATTGQIDPGFNPNLGGGVSSLDTDGTSVYVAGSFTSVGADTTRKRIVKLTADGAVVRGFKAMPNKPLTEVVVRGDRVYIGGNFTSVKNGTSNYPRGALAALDATTGSVLPSLDLPFTGVYDPNNTLNGKLGGITHITRFDVTADGETLAAIGNFAAVAGKPRVQLALLDLNVASTGVATVSPWATNRFDRAHNSCSKVFDTFMRDIDFSPDGGYFVVTTTGAFAGGAASGTLCDTSSRWETTSTGNDPTWIDYTGGDTTYGVAVTGSAVYTGGHFRWQNNPFQGDQAGPGAVARSGIAALDPANGLPLSWNPGRTRGVGAQALYATKDGLWVGSDTTKFKNLTRGRIAFAPLASGTTVPTVRASSLPNDLFLARSGQGGTPGVLQRRAIDGAGRLGAAATVNATFDWGSVRGAFLVNGVLYYGAADGTLYARTFEPATGALGEPRTVNLYADPDTGQRIPFTVGSLTGVFYDPALHRLYYTVSGDSRLYYRYFTPESEIVGAQTFQAAANGVSFSSAAGMTLAGGRILYGSSQDGALRSVAYDGGRVTGAPAVLSSDGTWNVRALFVPSS